MQTQPYVTICTPYYMIKGSKGILPSFMINQITTCYAFP